VVPATSTEEILFPLVIVTPLFAVEPLIGVKTGVPLNVEPIANLTKTLELDEFPKDKEFSLKAPRLGRPLYVVQLRRLSMHVSDPWIRPLTIRGAPGALFEESAAHLGFPANERMPEMNAPTEPEYIVRLVVFPLFAV